MATPAGGCGESDEAGCTDIESSIQILSDCDDLNLNATSFSIQPHDGDGAFWTFTNWNEFDMDFVVVHVDTVGVFEATEKTSLLHGETSRTFHTGCENGWSEVHIYAVLLEEVENKTVCDGWDPVSYFSGLLMIDFANY